MSTTDFYFVQNDPILSNNDLTQIKWKVFDHYVFYVPQKTKNERNYNIFSRSCSTRPY